MLDALMSEERGVPGIAIITEPFRQTARAMAATWGVPDFPFLEMPHPIAVLDGDQLDDRASDLLPGIIELLKPRTP